MKHSLLSISALVIAAILCSSCGAGAKLGTRTVAESHSTIIPEYLEPGDRVAIVAPAYYGKEPAVTVTDSVLRSWGLVPVIGQSIGSDPYMGKFAGTDKQRARELERAYRDPRIKAVFCARGGYGSLHLVNLLPPDLFRNNPKWLIGYSDITTLLCNASAQGVAGIHGAMCNSFLRDNGADKSCTAVRDILFGEFPEYDIPASPGDICGKAIGKVVGGNLSTLHPLLGTPADPFRGDDDLILFVEEVGENYHSIDRMMCILRDHGAFEHVRGILFGGFTDCEADLECDGIAALMKQFVEPLGIPVCYGLSFGHDAVNLPLVTGATASLTVGKKGSSLKYCPDAPQFGCDPIAVCGDNKLVVLDAARSDGESLCVLWSWETDDKDFFPLDECKPSSDWSRILITSSKNAAAILDTQSGELVFKTSAPMAHSIELLPGDRVAVCLSTNPRGNSLEIYDIDNPDVPIIRDTMYSAHGVVWNAARESMFTLNYDELREYKLVGWDSDEPEIQRVGTWTIPGISGHDLSPVDDDHLLVTDNRGTYMFDIAAGSFSEFEPTGGLKRIKSINYDPVSGRLIYTVAEIEWWTHHIYIKNPDKVLNLENINVYKVRR